MISFKSENNVTRTIIVSPYIKGAVVLYLQGKFQMLEYKTNIIKWAEGNAEFPIELNPFFISAHHQLVF